MPPCDVIVQGAWLGKTTQIPFQIHQKAWNSITGELLRDDLEGLGLSSSCCTSYQAVAVHGGQRDLDLQTFHRFSIQHGSSQDDAILFEGIAFGNLFLECVY